MANAESALVWATFAKIPFSSSVFPLVLGGVGVGLLASIISARDPELLFLLFSHISQSNLARSQHFIQTVQP